MRSSVLYVLIGMTGMIFGAEIVASHFTQSLSLLVSAYHMLYNLLSLLLLVLSHKMSSGKTLKNTFGWARIKVLGLHVNMLVVGALCFSAFLEALQTIVHAPHENTTPPYPAFLLGLGLADLGLNILTFLLIGGYSHHQGCSMMSAEVRADCSLTDTPTVDDSSHTQLTFWTKAGDWCGHVLLDVSRDVSSCLSVIACAAILLLMDGLLLKYVDSILAMASVVVLIATTYPFIRESALILLQSIPRHIDVEGLTKRLITEFPELVNVHDLHVWRLGVVEVIATAHIVLPSARSYASIEGPLAHFFQREGISSHTIQPEFTNGSWSEKSKTGCFLQCSVNNNCGAFTCCGLLQDDAHDFDYSAIATSPETIL